jgi:MFS family permease
VSSAAGSRRSTLPLYAGGFLGPFGGGMLVALIPDVADGLGTSDGLVAAAITAYMVPFAALQLVSGTIGERVGGGRVVRVGYVCFAAAAVLCAAAPEIWTFMAGRALMGSANAFLSPILLAALSEAVPAPVLGRAVGTFAAVQVAGLSLAPILGGALGEASWRLAFLLAAVVAVVLAIPKLDFQATGTGRSHRPTLRVLLNRWMGLVAATATTAYLGFTSIGFVVALVVAREFGLSSATIGLVVATYGAGGIVLGRYAGAMADRAGRPQTALLGTLACTCGVVCLAFAPNVWALALVYFAIGCASAFVWAGLNTIVVESFSENRAGAVSVFSAFKFAGVAVAPIVYVPILDADTRLPFLVATGFSAVTAILVLPWFRRYRPALPAPSLETPTRGAG